jgi:hypothetical protein
MLYFQNLPKIVNQTTSNSSILMTNLLTRVNIIPDLLKNPLLYYQYDIQDNDTPEIVAEKYYGSSEYFWVVMMSNQLLDPQWDWPLSYINFLSYMEQKYGSVANSQSQIYGYEQIITTIDGYSGESSTITINIDENEYANLVASTNQTYQLPNNTVIVETSANIVYAYDYENNLNESKRTINLLNSSYLSTIQQQFYDLTHNFK